MFAYRLNRLEWLSRNAGKRTFSLLSTHDRFPTTLYRFQFGRHAALFDIGQNDGGWSKDAVEVSKDGLVRSKLSKSSPYSNGPVFMPNTRTMQQMARYDFERYEEDVRDGKSVTRPLILRVNRGTYVPSCLSLWREGAARFSLQPKDPISLGEFNQQLDNFYSQSAITFEVKEWLMDHPYEKSAVDDDELAWMQL